MDNPQLVGGVEVTAWYRTNEDGTPVYKGVYQTSAEPASANPSNTLFRAFDGSLRWGPSDTNPARAAERAVKEGYSLVTPLYWRGASDPHPTFDLDKLEQRVYEHRLEECTWGYPVPDKLADVRKQAAQLDSLRALMRRLDPQAILWNQHAPSEHQIRVWPEHPQTSSSAALPRVPLITQPPVQEELPLTAPRVALIV